MANDGRERDLMDENGGTAQVGEAMRDVPEQDGRATTQEAQRLVVTTIAAHAEALLRTARRHSLCHDDAQDAYQRGLEIFLRHAARLDPARASRWLHTVVKHEAMAVRKARQQLVAGEEVDLDGYEARHVSSPEEQVIGFEEVARSAEALKRLKPQEVHALWLQMQGHSYREIADATGWTYTKVNRCLTEGRRTFLARYAGIQAGEECERWQEALSLVADGEASAEQVALLRPHLRHCGPCRSTLRALAQARPALHAVLPVPLVVVAATDAGESLAGVITRTYEALVSLMHERTAALAVKGQMLLELPAATKTTAVAASALAIGGGAAGAERVVEREPQAATPAAVVQVEQQRQRPARPVVRVASGAATTTGRSATTTGRSATTTPPAYRESSRPSRVKRGARVIVAQPRAVTGRRSTGESPAASEQEFSAEELSPTPRARAGAAAVATTPEPAARPLPQPAPPEPIAADGGEFGFEE